VVSCNPNTRNKANDQNHYDTLTFPSAPPKEDLMTHSTIPASYYADDPLSESNNEMEEID